MINLQDLDLVAPCEAGFEIEPVPGVKLMVVGPYSRQARLSDIEYYRSIENLKAVELNGQDFADRADAYSVGKAANRITGWSGITEPYTPALAMELCRINPVIRVSVINESDKIENFMKGK